MLVIENPKESILNLYIQSHNVRRSIIKANLLDKIIAKNVIASTKRIFGLTQDKTNQPSVSLLEEMKPIEKSCHRKSQRLMYMAKSIAKKYGLKGIVKVPKQDGYLVII